MARKKKSNGEDMPAAPAKPRTTDRHKPRRTIAFKPSIYQRLQALATRNHRPLNWEAELMAESWLKQHEAE